MAIPRLTGNEVQQVSGLVAVYIESQREQAVSQSHPLTPAQVTVMAPFFSSGVLEDVRLVSGGHAIENPSFYPLLRSMGISGLPDFSAMSAITFDNVIVFRVPVTDSILFHELVHVEQYRQLGVQRFAELYVTGFLRDGGYERIPLEACNATRPPNHASSLRRNPELCIRFHVLRNCFLVPSRTL